MLIGDIELPRLKNAIEDSYASMLAPFATTRPKENSRDYSEDERPDENRGSFQRDRDRIIHSKAFRRLMYKTQVFVNHEGDYFRTRLTHTLEVAQIARGICKSLALNEDLAEAIALGHDLGHTPFGHAVEKFLNDELEKRQMGCYKHNEQSVRVVDFLERRCDKYPGLNLTHEVREGILKHTTDRSGVYENLNPYKPCFSIEGQIVALVDTLTYICHDLQDGINFGLVEKAYKKSKDVDAEITKIKEIIASLLELKTAELDFSQYSDTFFIKDLIHHLIMSITTQTVETIDEKNIRTLADVHSLCNSGEPIVGFKKVDENLFKKLKKAIYETIYGINTIVIMDSKATNVARELFDAFTNNPKLLPADQFYRYMNIENPEINHGFENNEIHVVCDYIAGMTDRFALEEHERIRNPRIKI